MSNPETGAALARLERAVGRLEQVARAPSTSGIAEAYALLEERHGLLRARIQEVIERLDSLIAGEGPL